MPAHEQLEPEIATGTRLGPYVVESFLGAGGMGQVYRARDERLQRAVAIKLLPSQFSADPDRLRRFEQEARLAGSLSHPNVLGVFDVGRHESSPFIVTELLEGQTLRERLRGHFLSPPQALEIARQLTDGLAAAHAKGIIHRDLKPSNVFLCTAGPVKILDFGVAKLLHREPETGEPTTGWTTEAVPGTLGYLSPEQARGHRVDHRADVFAFGCLLYETLSGHKAFPGDSPAEVLVATLSSEPPELSRVTGGVPPALSRVVRCCLAKDPDDRYSTVHDLRLALDSAGEQLARGVWLPRLRVGRGIRRAVAVTLAVTLAAAGAWAIWSRLVEGRLPAFTPRQLTDGAALEQHPAISPDGGFVAFSSVEAGNSDVWIADLQGEAALRLTSDDARDHSPTWFPDGGSLAFVSDRGGEPAIWKVSRLGGAPRLLVPNGQDPAVSPDGRLLAFTRPNREGFRKLAVVSLDRPAAVRFLSREGVWDDERPAWSPDGRTLAYADFNHLWLVDVEGGQPRRLTADGDVEVDPAWSPDGAYLYFSRLNDTVFGLWRRLVAGGPPEPVERGPGAARWPSLSRDGHRLAFTSATIRETLRVVDAASGRQSRFEEARRTVTPGVAPDGSAVAFVSLRRNGTDIWRLSLRDGELAASPERLTEDAGRAAWPRYSPDGRWVVYQVNLEGQRDIWTVPADGGPGRPFVTHPAQDMFPAWSTDGTRIAFITDRSGEDEVWVAPVRDGRPAGAPRRLVHGTLSLAWSPDGRQLAYIGSIEGEGDVWVTRVDGREPPRRLTTGAGATEVRWPDAGEGLLVLGLWGRHLQELRSVHPATLDVVPVREARPSGPFSEIQTFDVTPDGRWLILLEESRRGDVWILDAGDDSF
jgi:Tol biopolymer transport system component